MRLLFDTHIVLWALADDPHLGRRARAVILSRSNSGVGSVASAWEIAIKRALGRMDAPDDLAAAVTDSGLESPPITSEHAQTAGALPHHHDDPFDRMLVAHATLEGLRLVTGDDRIHHYDVPVLPA